VGVAWNRIKLDHAHCQALGALLWFVKCFWGVKKEDSYKNTPVPTCVRLSFKLKIRYISILHPVKKKMYFLYAEKTEKYIE
jgi:hypothetical protein